MTKCASFNYLYICFIINIYYEIQKKKKTMILLDTIIIKKNEENEKFNFLYLQINEWHQQWLSHDSYMLLHKSYNYN